MQARAQQIKEKARDKRLAKGFGSFLKGKDGAKKKKVRGKARDDDAYQNLSNEIMRPAVERKAEIAKAAFLALPKKKRIRIRRKYKARGGHFTFTGWYNKQQEAKRANGDGNHKKKDDARSSKKAAADVKPGKRAKENATPAPSPFVALMEPAVIVPDNVAEPVVAADAGSIVRHLDQSQLYRDWVSPITRRADEQLVQYGSPNKLKVGWISHALVKPVKGPTFLVKTNSEESLSAWDKLRLKIARARMKDGSVWLASWLAHNGAKYPRELREVTKLFGGKPIKNEDVNVRIERLFSLILHTELDMATAKGKKTKKPRSARPEKRGKKSDKGVTSKKTKVKAKASDKFSAKSDLITRKFDEHTIKRLVKENPFREGSNRAKLWEKLKKGMTVAEFVALGDGRARTELRGYVQNGWAKLRRPASA